MAAEIVDRLTPPPVPVSQLVRRSAAPPAVAALVLLREPAENATTPQVLRLVKAVVMGRELSRD